MKQYLYFVFQRNARERECYTFPKNLHIHLLLALEGTSRIHLLQHIYKANSLLPLVCHTGNQKKKVIFYFSFQYKIIYVYYFIFRKPLQIDSTNLVSTYHSASYAGCNSKNQNKSTNYKKTEQGSSGGGNSKSPVKATMMVHTGLVFVL